MLPSTRGVTVTFTGYGAAEHGRGDEDTRGRDERNHDAFEEA